MPVWMRGKRPPTPMKTRIDTSATMTRNVVPQRGCNVVLVRALATVSLLARLVGADRLVLGAVELEDAADVGNAADGEQVAETTTTSLNPPVSTWKPGDWTSSPRCSQRLTAAASVCGKATKMPSAKMSISQLAPPFLALFASAALVASAAPAGASSGSEVVR